MICWSISTQKGADTRIKKQDELVREVKGITGSVAKKPYEKRYRDWKSQHDMDEDMIYGYGA